MSTIKTRDGNEIYYKDLGRGQPVAFSHGWPLSSDGWEPQMLFFIKHGAPTTEADTINADILTFLKA